ncbi:diguanylate phosphodiesterase [Rhodococcus gordoniae]|uniref:Diguanylate phosphodiesterase n=1 Tax=Rhodococcus gordoniae TaxID=223392 RepID=A0A379M2H2_9NOCA|nr:DICT sensory domain-containing protein [Rhodococcus gordoniae]SUE15595.1 diguanylate phosphodiesterase [Rhodococcus gordoniae]
MHASAIHDLVDGTVVATAVSSIAADPGADRHIPVLAPLIELTHGAAENASVRDAVALVDEDEVFADPAVVLRRIAAVRERGVAVAVRVAESAPRATVVLALVEPEVVVVPAEALVTSDARAATTLLSLRAHCERTNSVVVAEGIDSDLHRQAALAHGIGFGCGAALSVPEDGTEPSSRCNRLFREPTWSAPLDAATASPFRILSAGRECVRSGKGLLVSMSADLEARATEAGADVIALGTFQHRDHFTGAARRRWMSMAGALAHVAVFAVGFGAGMSGTNLVPIEPHDPLVDEWNVILLGASFACALSALDLHRRSADGEREFEYVVSYDRGAVARAARATLVRPRTAPAEAPPPS